MRSVYLFSLVACVFGVMNLPLAEARDSKAKDKSQVCSYTVTNYKCVVTIDRMNPVTPPVIYVRNGGSVTVKVSHPSPLEDLTLDWKSSAIVIPPDTFQNAFSSLSGNVGKFTDVVRVQLPPTDPRVPARIVFPPCEIASANCDNAAYISNGQQTVMKSLRLFDPAGLASNGLKSIKAALQPPPVVESPYPMPWSNTQEWKTTVVAQLQVQAAKAKMSAFESQITLLASEVANFKANKTSPENIRDAATLDQNQTALKTAYDSFASIVAKIAVLEVAVNTIPCVGADITGKAVIDDVSLDKTNYQTQTWNLNSTNKLLASAKRVGADTLKSEDVALLSGLAEASSKVSLVTITVQFQSPSPVEVSSGLMVPFTPYRSFAKAAVAKNGVVSDNVVQETKTYTVIPMAFINVRLKEGTIRQQRSAVFATGGVGYNPATSTVEFGTGMTYSYRSIAISVLLDIGRDTQLGGGFTVGQSLGPTNAAANPITSTVWSVKPAAALSVRIPLGGSTGK